jgi:hypothetical protein
LGGALGSAGAGADMWQKVLEKRLREGWEEWVVVEEADE